MKEFIHEKSKHKMFTLKINIWQQLLLYLEKVKSAEKEKPYQFPHH
jgi:hypothetical protein